MKNFGKFLLMAVLAVLVGSLVFAQSSTMQQIKKQGYIRVAVANEIPYGFVNASGDAEGFGPQVAKIVLHKMGIDNIQWVVTEFGSLIPGLKAGRFDMVAAEQAINPARCQQVLFSHPNTTYGEGFLVKKGNPKDVTSYKDFVENKNLKFGIMSGADQLKFAHDYNIPDSQIVSVGSNADAAAAVATGRMSAYAATYLTAYNLAQKEPNKLQAIGVNPIINGKSERSWGAFTFAKNESDFVNAFNKVLDQVHQTDQYTKILKSYGLTQHDIDEVSDKTTKELCSGK
jgi:polar amino acid transport system substrate-binding protein